ncbi:TPM domain-containing protein [Luteolibacter soli]|uniref:TPM domain-containing protein n=1 Tax=Luteolibacter soli TaxID=3135280 RepID=A0ABU9AWP9_9BACT
MKCPRCVQVIHRGAGLCPHCGFGIAEMDARHGKDNVSLRRLADVAGLMRSRERGKVQSALDGFSRRFPQLFFAVYTGSAQGGGNLRQFGFWLLNRAAFEDVPVDRPNEAGILLVIDPESKSATLTWGYHLDPFLTEEDTFVCLSRAHAYFIEGRFADGTVVLAEQLGKILRKRAAQARRDPEKFERKVAPPPRTGEIARRIREGHRQMPVKSTEVIP